MSRRPANSVARFGGMQRMQLRLGAALLLLSTLLRPAAMAADSPQGEPRPRVLVHYMPWYSAPPLSEQWGWHWTMNHFDPEQFSSGRREIASQLYPVIGPYDSADPAVLEYHLLLMTLAGIDGVIVDWYGLHDFRDYARLHRHTAALVEAVDRHGLLFAVCYEDQTIHALVDAGRLASEERVSHARRELEWLAENWFSRPGYLRLEGQPVLLSFGQTGLSDEEWSQCLDGLEPQVAYFSQHHRRTAAVGAFDWPVPTKGLSAVDQFVERSADWPHAIPVAFPRFVDIYAEAGVRESWGRVEDFGGVTFRSSLEQALSTEAALIQIATWNDWGEGSSIEPSREYGYRDLEALQSLRRSLDSRFTAEPPDLRLPERLMTLRRRSRDKESRCRLDQVAAKLINGRIASAREELNRLEQLEDAAATRER